MVKGKAFLIEKEFGVPEKYSILFDLDAMQPEEFFRTPLQHSVAELEDRQSVVNLAQNLFAQWDASLYSDCIEGAIELKKMILNQSVITALSLIGEPQRIVTYRPDWVTIMPEELRSENEEVRSILDQIQVRVLLDSRLAPRAVCRDGLQVIEIGSLLRAFFIGVNRIFIIYQGKVQNRHTDKELQDFLWDHLRLYLARMACYPVHPLRLPLIHPNNPQVVTSSWWMATAQIRFLFLHEMAHLALDHLGTGNHIDLTHKLRSRFDFSPCQSSSLSKDECKELEADLLAFEWLKSYPPSKKSLDPLMMGLLFGSIRAVHSFCEFIHGTDISRAHTLIRIRGKTLGLSDGDSHGLFFKAFINGLAQFRADEIVPDLTQFYEYLNTQSIQIIE